MKRLEVHESAKFIVQDCVGEKDNTCSKNGMRTIKNTYPNSIPVSDNSINPTDFDYNSNPLADNYGPSSERPGHTGFEDQTVSCARKLDIGAIHVHSSEASQIKFFEGTVPFDKGNLFNFLSPRNGDHLAGI